MRRRVLVACHEHRTRQLDHAVVVDVGGIDLHRAVGTAARDVLAVKREVGERAVAVNENIGRQTNARRHFLLREHRRQTVRDAAGLHALDRGRAGAHRRLARHAERAVRVVIHPRGALAQAVRREQQQVLRAVPVHVGKLKRGVVGFEQHARRTVAVKVAHRQRTRAAARELPRDHKAASAVRGDSRVLDRLNGGRLACNGSGAQVVVALFLIDINLEVVARRGGRTTEKGDGLLDAVAV